MKKVKYQVTTPFASEEPGNILDAYKVCNDHGDDSKALIYHPKEENSEFPWQGHGCSSLELCKLNKAGYYISAGKDSYINLTPQADRLFKAKISKGIERENKDKIRKKLLKVKNILKDLDI